MATKINWRFDYHTKNLPTEVAHAVGRAFEKIVSSMQREVEANIAKQGHIRTGAFLKAVKAKSKCEQNPDGTWSIYALLGVDKNFSMNDKKGNNIVPYNYYHLIEFGFTQRDGMWHKPDSVFNSVKDKYESQVENEVAKETAKLI